jgi:flavin reductase (DIM6/NTAB) family NADH-FMN oxidoreductase RutF
MSFDPQTYKQAMSQWPSGVTVVTSQFQGQRVGITVSSFSSVSLEPPFVSVCISKNLFTHELITNSGVFAVNILSAQQVELGKIFAGYYKGIEDRFAGLDLRIESTGSPILPDTLAWLDCRVYRTYDGGDHTIFVGEVLSAGFPKTAIPLLYHNRTWGRYTRLMPEHVELNEVGLSEFLGFGNPRISAPRTAEILTLLRDTGIKRVHLATFGNPETVPQTAEWQSLFRQSSFPDEMVFTVEILNLYGLERAHLVGIRHVDFVVSASERHIHNVIGTSIDAVMQELSTLLKHAHEYDMRLRVVIDCAFGSTKEENDPERVIGLAKWCLALGADEIALADSHGLANPLQAQNLLGSILPMAGKTPVSLRLQNQRSMGLANVLAALEVGVIRFDTSLGGLKYLSTTEDTPNHLATEDVVHMLHEMGIQTGIDLAKLIEVSGQIKQMLAHTFGDSAERLLNGNLRE